MKFTATISEEEMIDYIKAQFEDPMTFNLKNYKPVVIEFEVEL